VAIVVTSGFFMFRRRASMTRRSRLRVFELIREMGMI
jgi:hypothetical protein